MRIFQLDFLLPALIIGIFAAFALSMLAHVFVIPHFKPAEGEYYDYPEEPAHSNIDVPALIDAKHREAPPNTAPIPKVPHMTYVFGEPLHDGDHTVRLYLALSQEERVIIKKNGLNERVVEEIPLFTSDELLSIRKMQNDELMTYLSPDAKATLKLQHQEQMNTLRNAKQTIVLEHLLQYPYERSFTSRLQATEHKKFLTKKLEALKNALEEFSE